jgi:A/G-specific adenine glycosylase
MQTISSAKLRTFHKALHDWYAQYGRHELPWRKTDDAYQIYISEVMLQQTQVQTVLNRFYHPFLTRFPSLQALADAPRDDVMKAWEGLGYYSRAANLHEAAKRAAPAMPDTVEGLEALPGIGRNTAHAVAAFAYHHPVPVMEANVKRVLCRIFAFEKPRPDALWTAAEQLLDKAQPFDYNQAMMDIGAMVCTKRQPNCASCPAQNICQGQQQPEAYPAKAVKKATPVRQAKLVVWQAQNSKLHLAPREGRFLRGLYGFPEYPLTAEAAALHNRAYDLAAATKLGDVSQTYSHFRMDAEVWLVQADEAGDGEEWFDKDEISKLALAGIDHKVMELCRASRVIFED